MKVFLFQHQKSAVEKVAFVISRASDPFWLAMVIGALAIASRHFEGHNRLFWAALLTLFLAVLPLVAVWLGLKKGRIKDIDLTKREERTPFIMLIIFFWLIGALLTWSLAAPRLVVALLVDALLTALAVLFINLFWKISNHSLAITVFCFFVNQLFGWHFWPVFILIPVVAWSRLVQKKHTWGQLAGGFFLGVGAWIVLRLFGY